jgi:diacylglycerol kinase (ATP)
VSAAGAENGPAQEIVLLIANPATRGDAGEIVAAVRSAAPSHVDVVVRFTSRGRALEDVVADVVERATMLVAVGGDGTVATVAALATRRGLPLGIIPGGSTNIVARELGIPTLPEAAAALIFGDHRRRRVDIGRCDGHFFLHMAGAGADSRLFLAANQRQKRYLGWLAYIVPAIRSAFLPPVRFTITTEQGSLSIVSPLVLVANGASILHPQLTVAAGIQKDDGWLDIFVFTPSNSSRVAMTAAQMMSRQLERSQFVTRLRARTVQIDADPPIAVEIDGDVISTTPVEVTVEHLALEIIAPI